MSLTCTIPSAAVPRKLPFKQRITILPSHQPLNEFIHHQSPRQHILSYSRFSLTVSSAPSLLYFAFSTGAMEMKANEQAKHFFDVCNKLFQLFANKLALHSFKHVTLGSKEKDLNRVNKIERKSKDTSLTTVQVQNIDDDDFFKEVTVGASSAKAVSIESEPEAEKVTRKMKKKPSMKKSSTMQPVGSTLGSKTIRPLKPVMRAASNIDERSGKFIQDMKEAIKTGSRLQPRAL